MEERDSARHIDAVYSMPSRTAQYGRREPRDLASLLAGAAQHGAAADRATARSNRALVASGIGTWALEAAAGGGPGS